jgi:hypothetical protein
MLSRHLRQNAVAYLALGIALSTGTAYAATTLPNGSVTTTKLAKDAVISKKVKNGSISGLDIRDGSLTDADLGDGSVGGAEVKNGSLTAPDLAQGSVGSNEVKDGSLLATDLAAGVLPPGSQIQVTRGFNPPIDPVTPRSGDFDSSQVTLATAGHLYVQWTMPALGITCASGQAVAGLFVDGTAVAGSGVPLGSTDNSRFVEVTGVVAVGAGVHTLVVGADCPVGVNPSSSGAAGPTSWTTITTS